MCGIAGQFGSTRFDAAPVLAALAHRGPDDHGHWATRCADGRTLHLVHTRLKILDLTQAAAQPMVLPRNAGPRQGCNRQLDGAAGGYSIVFNGEIYNFRSLRAELAGMGWTFASSGDTEVLLKGYAEWGTEVFAKCDGIFAVAIHDGPRNELVLARDHLGIKPLYVAAESPCELSFASEVRAIVAMRATPVRPDPLAVLEFLRTGSIPEPRTILEGVRAVPPGSFWRIPLVPDAIRPEPQTYWNPWSFVEPSTSLGDEAWIEAHCLMLGRTMEEQLVADVPVGLFLSGGLDSSVLLEQAARHGRERITAFTLAGEATTRNEADIAARTCRNLGVRHVASRLAGPRLHDWIRDGFAAMDQPSWDGLNTYLISRASRQEGLVAVLGGMGGDETHDVYGHAAQLARVMTIGRVLGSPGRFACRAALRLGGRFIDPLQAERVAMMFISRPAARSLLRAKRSFLTPTQIEALWPAGPVDSAEGLIGGVPSFEPESDARSAIAIAELHGYLRNTLLRDGDWATMANHQEYRVPLLGRRYVELMLGMPWRLKTGPGGRGKPLLAAMLSPENRALAAAPKQAFFLNTTDLLLGPMRDAFWHACGVLNAAAGFSARPDQSLAALACDRSMKLANRLWGLLALGGYLARLAGSGGVRPPARDAAIPVAGRI